MGLAKKTETTGIVGQTAIESGSQAALDRLKATVVKAEAEVRRDAALTGAKYKQRDFDQENRGKTKCVMFEAALMSPAIAGMQFTDMKEYLKLVEEAANAGYRYTWGE